MQTGQQKRRGDIGQRNILPVYPYSAVNAQFEICCFSVQKGNKHNVHSRVILHRCPLMWHLNEYWKEKLGSWRDPVPWPQLPNKLGHPLADSIIFIVQADPFLDWTPWTSWKSCLSSTSASNLFLSGCVRNVTRQESAPPHLWLLNLSYGSSLLHGALAWKSHQMESLTPSSSQSFALSSLALTYTVSCL